LASEVPSPDDLKQHFENLNPTPELLEKFRAYLTISRFADYDLGEDMMKVGRNSRMLKSLELQLGFIL